MKNKNQAFNTLVMRVRFVDLTATVNFVIMDLNPVS